MKVLIADDDLNDRKMLEAALSMWDYDVVSASDGKEAWDILQEDDAPRMAVLDWMMPNMNGVELCKKIKEKEKAPYLFVILLTSKREKEEIVVGLDAGADDFITKPFDPGELKSRIMAGIRVLDYESKIITMTEKRIALERDLKDKEMEEKLRQADKMITMGTMAAGVAHDINNPLSVAIGDITLLKRDVGDLLEFVNCFSSSTFPPEIQNEIEKLKKDRDISYITENLNKKVSRCGEAMGRVKEIVHGLKDFSRRDNKDEIVEIDIIKEIETSIQMIPKKYKREIEIKKELSPLPKISCFGRQIGQVFLNLIVNALQAMKNGGILKIETSGDNEHVCIKICDNGPGIPENKLEKIFEPFYTTKPVGEGTGLGLSMCASIIKKHKGEITAVNNADKGVTFTIKLLKKGVGSEELEI